MKARYGWSFIVVFVLAWDVVAALTGGESLTFTFRRAVAQGPWRWLALLVTLLLVVHLFLPPRLSRYDPLDRLYQHIASTLHDHRREGPA
jgi:hypothetical protein